MARICVSAVLALLLCLPLGGLAEAADAPFSLAEGLTWASAPGEAAAWLGEGAEFQEDMDEDLGKMGLVTRDDLTFAGLPCGRAAIIYYNDAMVFATFYFTAESVGGDMEGLVQAMRATLGEPEYVEDGAEMDDELPEEIESVRVHCRWAPDADTKVSVLEITEPDYPYLCSLFFENVPVSEALEIAMEVE